MYCRQQRKYRNIYWKRETLWRPAQTRCSRDYVCYTNILRIKRHSEIELHILKMCILLLFHFRILFFATIQLDSCQAIVSYSTTKYIFAHFVDILGYSRQISDQYHISKQNKHFCDSFPIQRHLRRRRRHVNWYGCQWRRSQRHHRKRRQFSKKSQLPCERNCRSSQWSR